MKKLAILAATLALAIIPALPASAMVIIDRVPPPTTHPGGNNNVSNTVPETCGTQFGVLPRVYAEQVAAIGDEKHVWVSELCENLGLLQSDGNGEYLRPAIAQNSVLVSVLREHGYFPDDVFAVKAVGNDTIHLFVHHFN